MPVQNQAAGQAVKSAKTYVGYADKGAKQLKSWVDAAQKLEKAGKSMSDMEQLLSKMSFASNLSAALGAASVALTVLQVLVPVKSTEDQILEAVQALGKQMGAMEKRISNRLNALSIDLSKAMVQIGLETAFITHVRTVSGDMQTIARMRRDQKDTSAQLQTLANRGTDDLSDAVTAIQTYMTGQTGTDLLALTYRKTYADPVALMDIGGFYLHMAQRAVTAHVGVEVAKAQIAATKAGKPLTQTQAITIAQNTIGDERYPDTYAARLKAIADACDRWARVCFDPRMSADVIEDFFNERISTTVVDAGNLQRSAQNALTMLSGHWPWLSWTVLCYPPLSGWDNHGFHYSGPQKRTKALFRTKDVAGDKLNVVLYFAPKSTRKAAPSYTLQNPPKPDAKRLKALKLSIAVLVHGNSPGRVASVKPLIMQYPIFKNPSKPTDWGGDMLWVGFDDSGQNTHMPPGRHDAFLGLASQNPFAIVRNVTASKPFAQATSSLTFYQGYAGLVVYTA
ncbi:hypothetical protein [uncultured Tateyamaria sp.]|uniref:hypothetical protein n=1 Tax=Tateyamaria sp. 1078 TaxID=3417464 RepID=UPI0026346B06|nr:hypothetical protein [uncultured Tateyamaria sp.]